METKPGRFDHRPGLFYFTLHIELTILKINKIIYV